MPDGQQDCEGLRQQVRALDEVFCRLGHDFERERRAQQRRKQMNTAWRGRSCIVWQVEACVYQGEPTGELVPFSEACDCQAPWGSRQSNGCVLRRGWAAAACLWVSSLIKTDKHLLRCLRSGTSFFLAAEEHQLGKARSAGSCTHRPQCLVASEGIDQGAEQVSRKHKPLCSNNYQLTQRPYVDFAV